MAGERRRPVTVLAIGLLGAGLLVAGCQQISGTPVAAAADPVPAGSTVVSSTAMSELFPQSSAAEPTASAAESSPTDPQSADPTAYPEGNGVDPCQLVGQADAEKLAGTKLDPPQPGEHACTYTGPVTGPTAQVEVYVGLGAKKQLDIENTLGHELRTLPGVGDEAWISDNGVYVRKGQLWISVLVVLLEDPAQYTKRLGDVATVAAGRL
jgi:hypothetical protein